MTGSALIVSLEAFKQRTISRWQENMIMCLYSHNIGYSTIIISYNEARQGCMHVNIQAMYEQGSQ